MEKKHGVMLTIVILLTSTAWATPVIFEDNFDDGVLDAAKWFKGVSAEDPPWSPVGNYVSEHDGIVTIAQATTNHGGRLISTPISVNQTGVITVTRRMRTHHTNDKFRAFQAIRGNDYSDWDANYFSRINYYDYDRTTYAYYGFGHHNDALNFDPIWDTWFDEVWTYDPVTGMTTYSINGATPLSWGGTVLDESVIRLDYCAEGWFNGHYIEMDYVTVQQEIPEPVTICLLGLGGLALLRKRRA